MKKKRIFLTFGLMLSLIFISATSAYAQEDMTSKNHYYELKFGDNFYLSAGAGFNLFMIQSIEGVDDDRPLKFVGALSLGKWITPYVGLRLEGVYGQLKIFDNAIDPVPSKNVGYMGVYGDFMWNASNTFGGYNPRRVVDIIPFAGVSYLKTVKKNFNGEKPHSFPMSAGIKINFRLAHYVDFFIQDRFTFTSDHFDGLVDGNFLEPIMSVTAGFTVKFGANRFIAYNPYEQRMLVNSLNDKINQLRSELETCLARKCPEPKPIPCPECPKCDLNSVVRFRINSAYISREQQVNVFNAAEWMKKHTNAVVEVVGYADKDTGTAEYNMELSQRRAQAVADELTKTYGIDASRIKVIAKGSTEQPYPEHNDWNRVVIFVNEK